MRIQDSIRGTDVRRLSACALMAALTAVCSQIQIPLPAIPINLALFAVHLSGALLGAAGGALSMVVYVLLGIIIIVAVCTILQKCKGVKNSLNTIRCDFLKALPLRIFSFHM